MSTDNNGVWAVAGGRFRVRLNGSGGITLELDYGSVEIDMDDEAAVDLSAALARATVARRQPSL